MVKETLSSILQTGFELLKPGLKNRFSVFIKHALAERAHNEVLEDGFDRIIDRWIRLPVFLAVTGRALVSSRLVRSEEKFIHENLEEQFKVIDRARDPLDLLFSISHNRSRSSKSLGHFKYVKLVKNLHLKRVELDYPRIKSINRKDHKQRKRKLSSSSESSLSIPTTPSLLDRKSIGPHPKQLSAKRVDPQLPVL